MTRSSIRSPPARTDSTAAQSTVSRPSIEVSTLTDHDNQVAPSPDDDPTGVRALLSALPEPDPMPDYLVERINASLAAAQAQRAASSPGVSVTPLVASRRRLPGRVLFAIAGAAAAAAVAMVAVVGSNLFQTLQPAESSSSLAAAIPSGSQEAGGAPPGALDKAAAGSASTPPLIQIRLSETRYTRADFATQARAMGSLALESNQSMTAEPQRLGGVGTAAGLTECLRAIGASGSQMVRADIAFYEGAPAVIIVATTNGIPTAYAVGRECSLAHAAVLRPATILP